MTDNVIPIRPAVIDRPRSGRPDPMEIPFNPFDATHVAAWNALCAVRRRALEARR